MVWPSRTARGNKRLRPKRRDVKIINRFRKNGNDDDCDGDDNGKSLDMILSSSSPPFSSPLSFSPPEREQPGILKAWRGRYRPGFRWDHGREKKKGNKKPQLN
jgi:hypothetical protein